MRKIYFFSILIALYSTQTKAQDYSYAWHGEQLNAELRHPQVIGNYLYYIGLTWTDTVDVNPTNGVDNYVPTSNDYFIVKMNTDGSYVQSLKLNFDGYIIDFVVDENDKLIICGVLDTAGADFDPSSNVIGCYSTLSPSVSYIAYYDANFNYISHFEYTYGTNFNGLNGIGIYDLSLTSSNKLLARGSLHGTVDLDFTSGVDNHSSVTYDDHFFMQIDHVNSQYNWGHVADWSNVLEIVALDDEALIIAKFNGDSTNVTPWTSPTYLYSVSLALTSPYFIAKYDANGNYVNSKLISALDYTSIDAIDIAAAKNGDFYFQFDYTSNDSIYIGSPASHEYMTTSTSGLSNVGLIKFNSNLDIDWNITLHSYGTISNYIACNESFVFSAGYVEDTIYFEKNNIVTQITDYTDGYEKTCFIAINSNGDFVKEISDENISGSLSNDNSLGQYIAIDDNSNAYIFSEVYGLFDLDPSAAVVSCNTIENDPLVSFRNYILRLNWSGYATNNEYQQNEFIIYPNPTNGLVTINSTENIVSIRVIDISGKTIYSNHDLNQNFQINLSNFESGIYIIQSSKADGEIFTSKIIKN